MRSGIPNEDWEPVVTLYGSDARDLVELTGNERGRNTRVLLVDSEADAVRPAWRPGILLGDALADPALRVVRRADVQGFDCELRRS